MSRRLKPYAFRLAKGDETAIHTFYAASRRIARGCAEAWAKARGWTLDEDAL